MSERSGMTVNERLYGEGLLADWDTAIQLGDRDRLAKLSRQVGVENESAAIIEVALSQSLGDSDV